MTIYTDQRGIVHVIMRNGDEYTVRGSNYVKVKVK